MKIGVCQLARFGDLVSAMPFVHDLAQKGNEIRWYCHKDFAPMLAGISYAQIVPLDTHHRDIAGAIIRGKADGCDKILSTQEDGNPDPFPRRPNFIQQQWSRAGYWEKFHDLPLVFDRRDLAGEAEAIKKYFPRTNKPVLAFALNGKSSAFGAAKNFEGWLRGAFWRYEVLDIGNLSFPRPDYLLAFLERSAVLVSIDTLHIHLAYATMTPTIVLSRSDPWCQSEPREHWLCRETYERVMTAGGRGQIIEILERRDFKLGRMVAGRGDAPAIVLTPPAAKPTLAETPEWFTSKDQPDVSIIVPLFKSAQVVVDQIKSWDLSDDKIAKEIVYVDDRCPHNSHLHVLKAWEGRQKELAGPVGKILLNNRNGGFGEACNLGASISSGEYLVFLNADTTVTPGWIRPMIDRMKSDASIGIVGNLQLKIINGKTTIDSAGSEWRWDCGEFSHIGRHSYHGKMLAPPFTTDNVPADMMAPQEREMVTGCCFLIRRKLFNDLGGFDLGYKIGYWEDADLCLRVRRAGYRVFFEPASKIFHRGGHSGGGHPFIGDNRKKFYAAWVTPGIIDGMVGAKRTYSPRHILLKRNSAQGDVMVAASMAPALKKKYPGCKISFQTKLGDVLRGNPHISPLVGRPDVEIDLNLCYENRYRVSIMRGFADACGVDVKDCQLFIDTQEYRGLPKEPYAVLAAQQTAWAGRNWKAERFSEVAAGLRERGYKVVAVGNSHDAKIPLTNISLDARGKTTIHQLAYIIKGAAVFVGIESFPSWIAQAFSIPGIVFMGSVSPELIIQNPCIHAVTAPDLPCLGCHHEQPAPRIGTSHCKLGHTKCETDVTAAMMLDELDKFVEHPVKLEACA